MQGGLPTNHQWPALGFGQISVVSVGPPRQPRVAYGVPCQPLVAYRCVLPYIKSDYDLPSPKRNWRIRQRSRHLQCGWNGTPPEQSTGKKIPELGEDRLQRSLAALPLITLVVVPSLTVQGPANICGQHLLRIRRYWKASLMGPTGPSQITMWRCPTESHHRVNPPASVALTYSEDFFRRPSMKRFRQSVKTSALSFRGQLQQPTQ